MAGLQRPTVTNVFDGQGCLIIFDPVSDYDNATVAQITANGIDVGQVINGSSEWTGEDAAFDNLTDEQGDVIVPRPTAGTAGFDFVMADFAAEKMKKFMHGREISLTGMDGSAFKGATKAIAIGDQMPVIEAPAAWVSATMDKVTFFPKARIVTSPTYQDGIMGLKSSVVAQDCNTTNLGTMMFIDKFTLTYAED